MPTILAAMFSPRISSKILFTLKNREYSCLAASDPASMQEKIKNNHIDLILISITPNDTVLKKIIHKLKESSQYQTVPVIAVVPKSNITEIDDIFNSGVDECITPPFKASVLLTKIADLLKKGVNLQEKPAIPEKLQEIYDRIQEEGRLLRDITEVFSGASVSDHKARRMSRPAPDWTAIITADAIEPFHISSEREYYLMKKQYMRKIPKEAAYNVQEKVLIKRTVNPLSASMDTSGCAYSNELYGIQTVKGFSCATLACILNSRYTHFYFQRFLPPKDGLRDLYLSKSDILSLPIILPQPQEQKILSEIYQKINSLYLQNTNKNQSSLEKIKLLKKMNQFIFDIFGFDNDAVKLLNSLHF